MPSKKQTKATNKKINKLTPTEKLKNQINELKSSIDESNDKHIRLKAEFDNYRKRKDKEIISLMKYEGEAVIDDTQSQAFVFTVNDFDQDGDLDIASCAYNQDDLNYFENELITLSNPTVTSSLFGLWPNPTSNEIVISSAIEEEIDLTIYDSTGRIVAAVRSYTNTSIDLSTLTAGLYLLQIDAYQTTLKFVKQ